jgi:hypothetical protein
LPAFAALACITAHVPVWDNHSLVRDWPTWKMALLKHCSLLSKLKTTSLDRDHEAYNG